jgi:hypothetical protein
MANPSPITEKLMEVLTWDWVSQEVIYDTLVPLVPPGRAIRQYQVRTAAEAKKRQGAERVKRELTDPEKIASGARDIVRASMTSLVSNGFAERCITEESGAMLRRNDRRKAPNPVDQAGAGDCKECGRPFVQGREQKTRPMAAQVITIMDLLTARERRLGKEAK